MPGGYSHIHRKRARVNLISSKYEELVSYLSTIAYKADIYPEHREDVIHSVIVQLLEEDQSSPFSDARTLWGRATNLMKDECGRYFASMLPVSGVGRQAHYYARKYLSQNEWDPQQAYHNQTETPKVGLELLRIVAGGTGQTDPHAMNEYVRPPESAAEGLSEELEARVRESVSSLSETQREVVTRHVGLDQAPEPLSRIAADMNLSLSQVKAFWRSAKRTLSALLNDVSS